MLRPLELLHFNFVAFSRTSGGFFFEMVLMMITLKKMKLGSGSEAIQLGKNLWRAEVLSYFTINWLLDRIWSAWERLVIVNNFFFHVNYIFFLFIHFLFIFLQKWSMWIVQVRPFPMEPPLIFMINRSTTFFEGMCVPRSWTGLPWPCLCGWNIVKKHTTTGYSSRTCSKNGVTTRKEDPSYMDFAFLSWHNFSCVILHLKDTVAVINLLSFW